MVTHFAIEPHVFMAAPDENGVTIWSPIQHPFVLQRVVAASLSWPLSKVRIIAPDPGGGFGGKGWPKFEPLVAYLALRLGRPVRLVLTLEETFQQVRRTSASGTRANRLHRDGHIVFQDLETNFLLGAYADIGVRVVSKASYAACGPYKTPHARVLARALLSHTTPTTAFRGFGTPQASWAVESQLTEAARRLGIDPVEIRLRNVPNKGRGVHPERHAVRRRLAAGDSARGQGARLGQAARREPRTRHLARAEELVDGVGLAGDRPASLRRQRVGAVRHVRHGAGRADRSRADRREGARRGASIAWRS